MGEHVTSASGTPAELSSLKLRFLASLNHEIRTPLSGILGMTDLLLETPLNEEQREWVGAARQCAESLHELLSVTLEYTSLTSGCVTLDEAEFALGDVLESAVQPFVPRAKEKSVELEHEFDRSVFRVVSGDAYRLRQICGLMLNNALRTTETGRILIQAAFCPGGRFSSGLEVIVTDTGKGVSDDERSAIDEMLRSDGLAGRCSSVGLGIVFLHRIVDLMKGSLTMDVLPVGGSRLAVFIPLEPSAVPARETHALNGVHAGSSCRILLVDDDRISQQVISYALNKAALPVDCVGDASAAIVAAQAHPYDLVLMDLHLQDTDGLTVTERLRQLPGYDSIPVVALTASSSDEVRALCRQRGLAAFLTKPVDSSLLVSTLRDHLSNLNNANSVEPAPSL